MNVGNDLHMIHAWLQILAQGKYLTAYLKKVVHGAKYLLLFLSQSQH